MLIDHNRVLEFTSQQTDNSLWAKLTFKCFDSLKLLNFLVVLFADMILELKGVLVPLAEKNRLSFL